MIHLFLSHLLKPWEDSVMMLASTQETQNKKGNNIKHINPLTCLIPPGSLQKDQYDTDTAQKGCCCALQLTSMMCLTLLVSFFVFRVAGGASSSASSVCTEEMAALTAAAASVSRVVQIVWANIFDLFRPAKIAAFCGAIICYSRQC